MSGDDDMLQATWAIMTSCWPAEWREDYADQNELLKEEGEELLSPEEYLKCRYEDLEEARAALRP